MLRPRCLLFGVLLVQFAYQAYAMDCSVGGFIISCPTIVDNSNEVFCCQSDLSNRVEVCCNAEEFLKQNTGILAGILIGALVLVIIITLCCCCFCSCCCLAQRRMQRGTVLYDPINGPPQATLMTPTISSPSSYTIVHPAPTSQVPYPPPPYQVPTTNPYQPPVNPNYK